MKQFLSLLLITALLAGASPPRAAAEPHEKLLVMVYDRGNMNDSYGTPAHNFWTEYVSQAVLRECGIEVEYLAVPRGYAEEQLSVMLAANTAPDVVFTYDYSLWKNLCERGGAADLTHNISAYGDQITEHLSAVLPYGQTQGRQYGIPALRSQVDVTSGFIRKDWLDALHIPLARNADGNYAVTTGELYGILRAFQTANLGGVPSGEAWGMMSYGTTNWPVLLLLEAFYDQAALTGDIAAAYPSFLYPGAKEGYRYLNRLYNDGLLYSNFALIGDADKSLYSRYIIDGNVGFWINDSWYGFGSSAMLSQLYAAHPDAEVVAVDITNAAGNPAYKYTYNRMGMMVFVPSSSSRVDAAVQYLNWLTNPQNYDTLIFGFEDEHYRLENGVHVPIDIAYNNATLISSADLGLTYIGSADSNMYFASMLELLPENQRALRVQAKQVAMSNTFSIDPLIGELDKETLYAQKLASIEKELRLRCILCPADAFDDTWDTMTALYLAAGGQEVINAKRAAYALTYP